MRFVSWNVNGIRAAMDKGFRDFVEGEQPDVLCLQETKALPEQVDLSWAERLGYCIQWNTAEKKGYSGTAIWSKTPMHKVGKGLGIAEHDNEGRIVKATIAGIQLVNVYTPNSQRGLARIDYRKRWDADFLAYIQTLRRRGPVLFCGDLNCSHHEIDLANPKSNRKNAGFSDEERAGLDAIVDAGYIDTFRYFESGPGHYSWWTYRNDARQRNIGWRLDYFWASPSLKARLQSARIRNDIFGSDHCPVEVEISEKKA
ncbi:MAG TPA: exodeoxyribonuclease III [Planctomycetaceae bacterium]|nr:exodeoxyribonuclease III [Planctomycetaceae bacterium]